jgi:hypothetical protein
VDIIDCVTDDDPRTAQRLLKRQMAQLKNMADDCLVKVTDIDQEMQVWLNYTAELHWACADTDRVVRRDLHDKATDRRIAEDQLKYQSDTVREAKETSETLGQHLETASRAFVKASDEFPNG